MPVALRRRSCRGCSPLTRFAATRVETRSSDWTTCRPRLALAGVNGLLPQPRQLGVSNAGRKLDRVLSWFTQARGRHEPLDRLFARATHARTMDAYKRPPPDEAYT